MKLPRGILSLLTVLILFAGVGSAVVWRLLADAEDATAEEEGPNLPDIEGVDVVSTNQFMGAQPVEGTEVVLDTLWVRVIAAGEAVASRTSSVASRAPGVVQRVYVRENSAVSRNQVLVQLDTVEAHMRLARAENELYRAEIQFEEAMLSGGDIADAAVREQRERILRAEILAGPQLNLEEAQMAMELTRIRAPFGGRVADLQAVEGAYLGNGADVLTLVQLDPMHIEVNVPESYMGYMEPGRRGQVTITAIPGEVFTATVQSVNPRVDTETRAGRVTLALPNPDGRILPGFYARVSLDAEAFPDRVLIPREAVLQRDRRDMVFLLKGADEQGTGLADWKYVTVGVNNDTHVEIIPHDDTSMLEPGDIVLTDGHHYLAHDAGVRLVENVTAAGGRPGGQ